MTSKVPLKKNIRCPYCGCNHYPSWVLTLGLAKFGCDFLLKLLQANGSLVTYNAFGVSKQTAKIYATVVRRALQLIPIGIIHDLERGGYYIKYLSGYSPLRYPAVESVEHSSPEREETIHPR